MHLRALVLSVLLPLAAVVGAVRYPELVNGVATLARRAMAIVS
jgi:hypothetical protein